MVIRTLPLIIFIGLFSDGVASTGWNEPGPFPAGRQPFASVHFWNGTNGLAAGGDQGLLRTADGGATWSAVPGAPAAYLYDMCFPDSSIGFASGGTGHIFKTTDAGAHWIGLDSLTDGNFTSLAFIGKETGFALAEFSAENLGSQIWRTRDGGAHWAKTNLISNKFVGVRFFGPRLGFVFGGGFGSSPYRLYRTLDGGDTWVGITQTPSIYSMHMFAADSGFAVGAIQNDSGTVTNAIYRTSDGGATWTPIRNGHQVRFNSLLFTDRLTGYAAGGAASTGGVILKTSDGGATWTEQWRHPGTYIRRLFFAGSVHGFALGYDRFAEQPPYPGLFLRIQEGPLSLTPRGKTKWVFHGNGLGLVNGSGERDALGRRGRLPAVFRLFDRD